MTTLFRAGSVHSPGDPHSLGSSSHPAADALLVDGGRVAWVGRAAGPGAPAPDDVTAVVDVGDAFVTPAFVDAHVHLTEAGLALTGIDLRDARSVGAILDRVARATRERGGRPVLGHGWDEALLAEGRPPTAAELDRAGAGGVVYLSRVDVHSAVISSALAQASGAREVAGWDPSGRVERDAHHAARDATRTVLTPGDRGACQRAALQAAARAGIAAVHEMSAPHLAPEADLAELVSLTRSPHEGSRLPEVIAYRGQLVGSAGEARRVLARLPDGVAGLAGDLCVDGSIGSRTAAFQDDYADASGRRGHLYLSVEQIRDHVVACTQVGVQAGFHVIGDDAVDAVLQGFRRAAERVGLAQVRAARHRLEHLEAIAAELVAQVADLGLTASVQPAFDASWGGEHGMYATRLGTDRALALNPFATLDAAGVPLALGSDAPVTAFDPWGAVRAWSWHHVPGQRTAVRTALDAHTRGGWRAAGRDGCGELLAGSPATFAVWRTGEPAAATTYGGLPDLAPGRPLPQCLVTVRDGVVLHDASGAATRA